MTAPDPAADLLAAVGELAAQLAEVKDQIATLSWGVKHESSQLTDALGVLTDRVDALDASTQAAPVTNAPAAWVDTATATDWQGLAAWVDWLTGTYDLQPSRTVLPCWPAHPGVPEELAALRGAWQAAASGTGEEPTDALAFWHDRHLYSCLIRLREVYQQRNCQDRHTPARPGRSTDLDLLATAVVDNPCGVVMRQTCRRQRFDGDFVGHIP